MPPSKLSEINRRAFIGRLGAGALAATALAPWASCGHNGPETGRPPNIVLINADDLGLGDLSCYGSEIPTPNIDSIGEAGVRFTEFYVCSPVCTPSRFGQLTGKMPGRSVHGLETPLMPTDERDSGRGIEPSTPVIAGLLRQAGYSTGLVGKWHLGHGDRRFLPDNHGFDYFYGFTPGCIDYFTHKYRGDSCFYRNGEMIEEEEGYVTDLFNREAVSFIEDNHERPFYLNLAYNSPHYGKADKPGQAANVLQAPAELVEQFQYPDPDRNVYAAMVASMDNGVGRVLETLDRLGLNGNTLVVFTSDNGADPDYGGSNGPFRGEKGTLFEGGIRIPCLMRWPGVIPLARMSAQVCSHLDFFPTFAALAGQPAGDTTLDGRDMSALLHDPQQPPEDRTLYWDYAGWRAIRDNMYKYVSDNEGREYVFDLQADPFERNNLIAAEPALAAELSKKLDIFLNSIS